MSLQNLYLSNRESIKILLSIVLIFPTALGTGACQSISKEQTVVGSINQKHFLSNIMIEGSGNEVPATIIYSRRSFKQGTRQLRIRVELKNLANTSLCVPKDFFTSVKPYMDWPIWEVREKRRENRSDWAQKSSLAVARLRDYTTSRRGCDER